MLCAYNNNSPRFLLSTGGLEWDATCFPRDSFQPTFRNLEYNKLFQLTISYNTILLGWFRFAFLLLNRWIFRKFILVLLLVQRRLERVVGGLFYRFQVVFHSLTKRIGWHSWLLDNTSTWRNPNTTRQPNKWAPKGHVGNGIFSSFFLCVISRQSFQDIHLWVCDKLSQKVFSCWQQSCIQRLGFTLVILHNQVYKCFMLPTIFADNLITS